MKMVRLGGVRPGVYGVSFGIRWHCRPVPYYGPGKTWVPTDLYDSPVIHQVTLSDLKPGAKYHYRVQGASLSWILSCQCPAARLITKDGIPNLAHTFLMPPPAMPPPFSFLAKSLVVGMESLTSFFNHKITTFFWIMFTQIYWSQLS